MSAKPTVLFVCVHNAGRSQLAAGLAMARVGDRLHVTSAGTDPEDHVSDVVIASLAEVGTDWTGRAPARLTGQTVADADGIRPLREHLVQRITALTTDLTTIEENR